MPRGASKVSIPSVPEAQSGFLCEKKDRGCAVLHRLVVIGNHRTESQDLLRGCNFNRVQHCRRDVRLERRVE